MEISKLHGTTDTLEAQFKVRKKPTWGLLSEVFVYWNCIRSPGQWTSQGRVQNEVEMCDSATVPLILRPFSKHFSHFLACWMFLVVVVVGPVVPHQQNSIDLIDPHSKIAKIDPPSFEADLVYKPPFSRLM